MSRTGGFGPRSERSYAFDESQVDLDATTIRDHNLAFQASQSAIFIVDVDEGDEFIYRRVNPELLRVTGLAREDVEGRNPEEVFGPISGKTVRDRYRRCARQGQSLAYEEDLKIDGVVRHWLTRIAPVFGGGGDVSHIVGSAIEVSDLKRSEENLRAKGLDLERQNRLLNSILDHAPIGIWVADEDQDFVLVNRYFREATGIGKDCPSITREELAASRESDREVLLGGGPREFEERMTFCDEREHILQTIKARLDCEMNGRKMVLGLGLDITDRKKAEERSEELIREQRALLDNVGAKIWYLKDSGTCALTNKSFARFWGYEPEELEGVSLQWLMSQAEFEVNSDGNGLAFDSGQRVKTEEWITDGNGEPRLLMVERTPIADDDGIVRRVVCYARDITEQRLVEGALRASRREFQTLAENSPDLITRVGRDLRRTFTNPMVEEVFGVDQEQALGKTNREIGVDDSLTVRWESAVTEVFDAGLAQTREWSRGSGSDAKHYLTRIVPEFDGRGEVNSVLSISRDITEMKNMQIAKQESEEKYRAMVEQSGEMLYVHGIDGLISEVNQAAVDQTGYSRGDLRAMSVFDLQDISCSDEEMIQRWRSWEVGADPVVAEAEHRLADGSTLQVELSSRKIVFGGEEFILTLARDIADRKQAEARLRYQSFHDGLTGLYNRRFLEEEMKRLDTARQLPLSVVMVDLNGLKVVNDTYGHTTGDEMLVKAAKILRNCCREEDILGRWGGDEFVVVLPHADEEVADAMHRRIAIRSAKVSCGDVPISMTVGVSTKTQGGPILQEVLGEAEDDMYRHKLTESRSQKSNLVDALLAALAEKSHETEAHSSRMAEMALEIGERVGLRGSELNDLALVVKLHDIGKIKVPEDVLRKPDDLTQEEWDLIYTHPETGYRIARSTGEFAHVADEILAHHERWDGAGYPLGLAGREIPLLARIVAVVDAYEAMTRDRPYGNVLSVDDAVEELKRCAGTQFDPALVPVAVKYLGG